MATQGQIQNIRKDPSQTAYLSERLPDELRRRRLWDRQRYMCCQAREEDSSGLRDERLNPYHEEKYQMFQV